MWMWFIRVMGGAVVNRVRFIQGEDKHVKLLVRSPNNEPFTILAASYSLSRFGEVESHGECEINGHYLDIKLHQCKRRSLIYWKLLMWLLIQRGK